jgi:hypothetical protein
MAALGKSWRRHRARPAIGEAVDASAYNLLRAGLDWAKMWVPRGGSYPGRAARGSVAPRKMACRLARGGKLHTRFKVIDAR